MYHDTVNSQNFKNVFFLLFVWSTVVPLQRKSLTQVGLTQSHVTQCVFIMCIVHTGERGHMLCVYVYVYVYVLIECNVSLEGRRLSTLRFMALGPQYSANTN